MNGLLQKLRRFAAWTLTLALALPTAAPQFGMTAYATEQETTPGLESPWGKSDVSAFQINTNTVDIVGLGSGGNEYLQNSSTTIKTTYNYGGYTMGTRAGGNVYQYTLNQGPNGLGTNGSIQTISAPDGTYEFRVEVASSPDRQYIFFDYYLTDISGAAARPVDMFIDADVNIGNNRGSAAQHSGDFADLTANSRGLHMVNGETQETFDLITNDPNLGVDEMTSRWIGFYSSRQGYRFDQPPITNPVIGIDSGFAASWKVQLRPYETVHRRLAFAIRATSYYVSSANGSDAASTTGSYRDPFRTIQAAVDRLGSRKGYIYIMDYTPGTDNLPVTLSGSDVQDITISSTDFNKEGEPVSEIKTLTRNSSQTFFENNGQGRLSLTNIKLDGSGQSGALVSSSQSDSRLLLNTDFIGTGVAGGDAVITAAGQLSILGGQITGNSGLGQSAVYFTGNTDPVIANEVSIIGNTNASGKPANLYLPDGRKLIVNNDLGASEIGVTTQTEPAASQLGDATDAAQEKIIAELGESYPGKDTLSTPPFVNNFKSDRSLGGETSFYIATGTNKPGDGGFDNSMKAVLRAIGNTLTVTHQNDAGAELTDRPVENLLYAPGQAVNITYNAPDGYGISRVDIQPAGSSVTSSPTIQSGSSVGAVTLGGTMPNNAVNVTLTYQRADIHLKFDARGGVPKPVDIVGKEGDRVYMSLPSVSKIGYLFQKWSTSPTYAQMPTNLIEHLPENFPGQTTTYHAYFIPDQSKTFTLSQSHQNAAGNLIFRSSTSEGKHASDAITTTDAAPLRVPGYTFSADDSREIPSSYTFPDVDYPDNASYPDERIGKWTDAGFTGKMPGQDALLQFVYKPDPSDKNNFTIEYRLGSENGPVIKDAWQGSFSPEEPIEADAPSLEGYMYQRAVLTHEGRDDGQNTNLGEVELGRNGNLDGAGGFSGIMPNQKVKIVMIYASEQLQSRFTTAYEDETVPEDSSLRNIIEPDIRFSAVGEEVKSEYKDFYGYEAGTGRATPSSAGRFDSATKDFTGNMPTDENLTVTYGYLRKADQWAKLTFLPGDHGSLSDRDRDPALTAGSAAGTFTVSVLKGERGADGQPTDPDRGLTWKQIHDRNLVPDVIPDPYYTTAAGGDHVDDTNHTWIVDVDKDGKLSDDEIYDEQGNIKFAYGTQTFSEDTQLIALYEQETGVWADIKLALKETVPPQGQFANTVSPDPVSGANAGATLQLRVPFDKKWAGTAENSFGFGRRPLESKNEILPAVNYVFGDWYDADGNLMTDTSDLTEGATYYYQFKKNENAFGTNVRVPDAAGEIDDANGKGVIVVPGTLASYNYILTDENGTVLKVLAGAYGQVRFDGLYPEGLYYVHEAVKDAGIAEGDTIPITSTDATKISDGCEVRVPVLGNNYEVAYEDENEASENALSLTIRPADPDSEYALLDSDGTVVDAFGSVLDGKISFRGLTLDDEYVVVARPSGSTLTENEQYPYGSTVRIIPETIVETRTYLLKTTAGGVIESVDGETPEDSVRNETVKDADIRVSAPEANSDGRAFRHWEILFGSIPGHGKMITDREFSFKMPAGNLLLSAVYEQDPGSAGITVGQRGTHSANFTMDDAAKQALSEELTTDADRVLIEENGRDVEYRLTYNKSNVAKNDKDRIAEIPDAVAPKHEASYEGAVRVKLTSDRYVDGRKVATASEATPSVATHVQLGSEDIDMLDYQLYKIGRDESGALDPDQTQLVLDWNNATGSSDPYNYPDMEKHGLFSFEAEIGTEYILIYSKSYRQTFRNPYGQELGQRDPAISFKIRKGMNFDENTAFEADTGQTQPFGYQRTEDYLEALKMEGGTFDFTYGEQELPVMDETKGRLTPENTYLSFESGIEYSFDPEKGEWSLKRESYKAFDPGAPVRKKQDIYIYYKNNQKDVEGNQSDLEDLIKDGLELGNDYFLREPEKEVLQDALIGALDVLKQTAPKASAEELKNAYDLLKPVINEMRDILNDRHETNHDLSGNGSGTGSGNGTPNKPGSGSSQGSGGSSASGGSSGSGGGGGSTTAGNFNPGLGAGNYGGPTGPYTDDPNANYGGIVNGSWIAEDVAGKRWRFLTNGGLSLQRKWARLYYRDGDNGKTYWYHFDPQGYLNYGWFVDEAGDWYYLNPNSDGFLGRMLTGWHEDETDGNRYYLDPETGRMATGWRQIDGKWYYFNTMTSQITYDYDPTSDRWNFNGSDRLPYGALLRSTTTPDGYRVGEDGAMLDA